MSGKPPVDDYVVGLWPRTLVSSHLTAAAGVMGLEPLRPTYTTPASPWVRPTYTTPALPWLRPTYTMPALPWVNRWRAQLHHASIAVGEQVLALLLPSFDGG